MVENVVGPIAGAVTDPSGVFGERRGVSPTWKLSTSRASTSGLRPDARQE